MSGELAINTGLTLYRALVGFLICMVVGILIGVAMSRNVIANWFFDPIVSVGFPMPKIAFLPVVILWLGVYDVSKITIIVIDAIFPVIAATVIAIRGVERELIWSARNMGANNRELMWQIVLPAAMPQILTGLQVALPISMIVAVVTEMLMGGYGLGGAMMTASRFANSRGVFAGIVEIAVVGYCLVKAMAMVRRRLADLASGSQRTDHGLRGGNPSSIRLGVHRRAASCRAGATNDAAGCRMFGRTAMV